MQRLWIKPVGEGDYLVCLDSDGAKAVHVAFYIVLEVAIGDRTQKWHSGMSKRTAVSCQVMSGLSQKQTSRHLQPMSALPPKADIGTKPRDVGFVPKADIGSEFSHLRISGIDSSTRRAAKSYYDPATVSIR